MFWLNTKYRSGYKNHFLHFEFIVIIFFISSHCFSVLRFCILNANQICFRELTWNAFSKLQDFSLRFVNVIILFQRFQFSCLNFRPKEHTQFPPPKKKTHTHNPHTPKNRQHVSAIDLIIRYKISD